MALAATITPAQAQDASSSASQTACNTGPYIVFFDWNGSDISPAAATILDSAIAAYANCGHAAVTLAAHADRSGSDAYNLDLSGQRNASIEAYLVSHGISAATITSHALGETMPRVATADGVREAQNRRVEITYGAGG
jgi:outer membrane protein OmpA-like peptidoglycan-associated protein